MVWADTLIAVTQRFREPEILTPPIPGELDIPYFDKDELEDHLLIVCNDLLREVSEDDLMAIGSAALTTKSGSAVFRGSMFRSLDIPDDVVGVLAETIGGEPCVEAAPAGFFQLIKVDSSLDSAYLFAEGKGLFYGDGSRSLRMTFLLELDLQTWQSDVVILPPAFELEAIERCVARLHMIDFLEPMTMYGGANNELN